MNWVFFTRALYPSHFSSEAQSWAESFTALLVVADSEQDCASPVVVGVVAAPVVVGVVVGCSCSWCVLAVPEVQLTVIQGTLVSLITATMEWHLK